LFVYTVPERAKDLGLSELDRFRRGAEQIAQDLKNLPRDIVNTRIRTPGEVQQGDASPQANITSGNDRTPPTATAVVTPSAMPCGPGVLCPTLSVAPAVTPSLPMLSSGNGGDDDSGDHASNPKPSPSNQQASNGTGLGSALNGIYSSASPMNELLPELRGVNPHYVENAGGGININCVSCVNATQARLTGQDLNAVASRPNGYANQNELLPSAPFGFGEVTNPASVVSEMLMAGEGTARPLIIIQAGNVQHVINVVNKGGQVHFVDSQIGKIVTLQPDIPVRLGNAP
jgi:hypothetical protein